MLLENRDSGKNFRDVAESEVGLKTSRSGAVERT
jgi:hypothetical protein